VKHPELDGTWFPGFDYRLWDYWASNSDAGWVVWCIETGWRQAWITSVLGLRQKKSSLWDLAVRSRVGEEQPDPVGHLLNVSSVKPSSAARMSRSSFLPV